MLLLLLSLFTYSSYTKRDSHKGDALFLAAHTLNGELVTVEFSRVPYHLFLGHEATKAVCLDGLHGKSLQLTIERHAKRFACTRRLDSSGEITELVELRFYSWIRYTEVLQLLKGKNIPIFIDGSHDALQGLDALLNLGIPGTPAAICLKPTAGILVGTSRWCITSPRHVYVHDIIPPVPSNLTEVAIGVGPDGNICVGYRDQVAWFGDKDARIFEKQMTKIRPTVIVVRDREATMRRLHAYAQSFFPNLFSLTPLCPPKLSTHD